jgi:outer membrane receptor protein involved in Fe transport
MFVRADGSYTSETNAQTIGLSQVPSYTLVNARLGLRRGPLELALWGRNITDEKYVAAVIFQPPVSSFPAPTFIPNVTMGERLTYGLTATYSFGE